ncbi:MAG TPA: VUT family protein [Steroidobacteraceae bacterium]|nr:VUT family protein [Steroidobacteraceae bacterium]
MPQNPAAAAIASRESRLLVALAGLFVTNALIAEFIGVKIFALEDKLGRATGERLVWLRATGSTAVSQLIDSFIVPLPYLGRRLIRAYLGRTMAAA